MRSMSPGWTDWLEIFWPLTKVPLVLLRSVTWTPRELGCSRACFREVIESKARGISMDFAAHFHRAA